MAINATTPVVVPPTAGITYDQWFLTQIVGKVSPTAAPITITLNRSATVNGQNVLMPNSTPNATVTFTVDLWQAATAFPAVATAEEALVAAIVAYATSKNLL